MHKLHPENCVMIMVNKQDNRLSLHVVISLIVLF